MDFAKLSRDSSALLEQLADRLPADQLAISRDHSKGGEWSELINNMCAVLVKRQIPVTPAERDTLAGLLRMYPSPYEGYEYISNRNETLAALTIHT